MFRSSKPRDSVASVADLDVRPRRSEADYETTHWTVLSRKIRNGFSSRGSNKKQSLYIELDSSFDSPSPRMLQIPPPLEGKDLKRASWSRARLQKSQPPPVPAKDIRQDSQSYVGKAVSRSRKQTQSVSYGKPVVVQINPLRHNPYEAPPVYTSRPSQAEEVRARSELPGIAVAAATTRPHSYHPSTGMQASTQAEKRRPLSGAYVPTQTRKALASLPTLPREQPIRQYPRLHTQIEDILRAPREYGSSLSPLPSPTDHQTFLEGSKRAARRIEAQTWEREREAEKDSLWGVMKDITQNSLSPTAVAPVPTLKRHGHFKERPLSKIFLSDSKRQVIPPNVVEMLRE